MGNDMREVFKTRIKMLREAIGASQEEMAEALGISRQSISLYEQGKRLPDVNVLDNIHTVTGCSLNYLFGYSETMSEKWNDENGVTLLPEGISESTLHAITHLYNHEAQVMDALMLEQSPFYELIHLLSVYASGKARKRFDDSAIVSQYHEFKCHGLFDRVLEWINQQGLKFITGDEWDEIHEREKRRDEEYRAWLSEMKLEQEEEHMQGREVIAQIEREIADAGKDNKFTAFRNRMWGLDDENRGV